jgi:predicted DNA-binding transcriptional regulator YafY
VWLDLPLEKARSHFACNRVMVEDENKGVTLRCSRENLESFAAMLLTFGRTIVVRQPPELREAFGRLASRAAQAAGSATETGVSAGV